MRRARVVASLVTAVLAVTAGSASAAKPVLEPMYANGTTVYMSAPANAQANGNNAQDFYLIAYPATVPAGVHPLCNFNCPGPPDIPPVRDVVLAGAPGFGTMGTAGKFNPLWHVIALAYSPAWVADPSFTPATSEAQVDAGEAAGHFIPINPGGDNMFEVDTGIQFLCVLVSKNA
ncbi:MAG TPA: hypothetical protein VJ872_13570 [Nocardioides sp.]|nr:hypothetical protein [Nocardioides sp.]